VQIVADRLIYSASDLNNYLDCSFLTTLDLQVAKKELTRPEPSAVAKLISELGLAHEASYLETLRARDDVVDLAPEEGARGTTIAQLEADAAHTEAAMANGAPVIYQGTFFDGTFLGRSDFLVRVDRPCARWAWSYEVVDTKLAFETKPYFIIQLCHYSAQLERVQGTAPKQMHVLLGNGNRESHAVGDFAAYYRRLKQSFLRDAPTGNGAYPLPVEHCGICPWNGSCDGRRRADDHLSLVAGMRNDQIARLGKGGISTVAALADADARRPYAMEPRTFERLQLQARLQVEQRRTGTPTYHLLPPRQWFGFSLMPAPDPGDVFFDMEGDPLYELGTGLEYLFGWWTLDGPGYGRSWALDRAQEKLALERFVDFIVERRHRYPAAHVYHYANYEVSALRRLAQRHCTREDEVDELLRGEVFVDLYAVVRQSIMISQESYSIKKLEPLYGFERHTDLRRGDDSIVLFEEWRRSLNQDVLEEIEAYNTDDCRSTYLLRDWLLQLRIEAEQRFGVAVPLRAVKQPKDLCHPVIVAGCKSCADRERAEREAQRTSATQQALLAGVEAPRSAADLAALPEATRLRFLMGNLLAYHRREDKPVFWQFYDRCTDADRLVEFDKDCLGGLEYRADVPPYKAKAGERNLSFTYRFPDQVHRLGNSEIYDAVYHRDGRVGDVVRIDEDANEIVIKLTAKFADRPASVTALIPRDYVEADQQKAALARIGAGILAGTVETQSALVDLLLARSPRLAGRLPGLPIQPAVVDAEAILDVVRRLDSSVLFIQGPPGTGKSTKAGQIIARLLRDGKRVGVLSNSHKAIHNLDRKVEEAALALGHPFRGVHKASKSNEGSPYASDIGFIGCATDNKAVDAGDYQFVSGNAWFFARDEAIEKFDYLFVDEAGQIALADAVAIAPAARNLIFIGDPLQLAQVSQGVHPVGVGVSVLQHMLGDARTIAEDRGIFLNVTHRLHPEICTFISEAIYDGRLVPGEDTIHQSIGDGAAFGSGLRYWPVAHVGNSRESAQEAEEAVRIVRSLLGSRLVDEHGNARAANAADVIVVAPYNAQRHCIRKALDAAGCEDVEVGTVDKFQGQEAFAVVYSMAASSDADVPRGLDFLFDRNRFNVAVSRARALPIVLCSGLLVESRARNLDDMRLLSLFCRYVELARVGHPEPSAAGALR
jgi:uncharacterized protein